MSALRSEAAFRATGVLGAALLRAYFATTRWETRGEENFLRFRRAGEPVIFVFWHGALLPLLYRHRQEGVVVLVSEHADGEYVTRVLERLGFRSARGSSTRGATRGLKALLRAARSGSDLALTPDGPRGPARVFKPGALGVAALTGLPIIPVAVEAWPAWRLRSWDAFLVPRPFSRVRVSYGAPHRVEAGAEGERLEAHAHTLARALDALSGTEQPSRAAAAPPEVRR